MMNEVSGVSTTYGRPQFGPCPPRFSDLKKEIADSYTDFEAGITKAWGEILTELDKVTKDIASQGSQVGDHTALAHLPELIFSVIS